MNTDAQPDLSALTRFLDAAWLQRGLSENTRMAYRSDLEQFAQWLLLREQTLLQVRRDTLLETFLGGKGNNGNRDLRSTTTENFDVEGSMQRRTDQR